MFQQSLDEGAFSSILKFSSVIRTPIFKPDYKAFISNYRLISIQSHIYKMSIDYSLFYNQWFESLVLNSLQPTINNILIEEHHGFRPGPSTTTCNLIFCNYIFEAFQNRSQVDVIYLDFNKAFDTINRNAIVSVIKQSGIGQPFFFIMDHVGTILTTDTHG